MGSRKLAVLIVTMASLSMMACVDEKPIGGGPAQQVQRVEIAFRDQVEDVRQGESTKIHVREEKIDDAHFARLAGLENLEVLNIPDGAITDQGLAVLAGLPKLMLLRLSSPNMTDAGLKEIAKIKSLRFLHLIDVPITDAGLVHLHGMSGLESFYLDGSKATDEGIKQMLEALPELHFHRDQKHLHSDPNKHEHE